MNWREIECGWPRRQWIVEGVYKATQAEGVGGRVGIVEDLSRGLAKCVDRSVSPHGEGLVVTCRYELVQEHKHGDQGSQSMPPYKGPATPKVDMINHAPHYEVGGLEPIDMIEAKQLGFHLGNALKYICRCQFKGDRKTDIEKAIWYLERYLETIKTEA
jgi:hypothetical protein